MISLKKMPGVRCYVYNAQRLRFFQEQYILSEYTYNHQMHIVWLFNLVWLSQLQLNDIMSLLHCFYVSYSPEIECMCEMCRE